MTLPQWGAAEWAAFGAVGALVVYVILGVFAGWQLVEARRTREEQSRPYVIVDFVFQRFLIYIEIKNIGSTPARDVTLTFDRPLETTLSRAYDINEASVLQSPIPMLAPGRSIKLTFDVGHQRFAREDLPLRYLVDVTYTDGKKRRFKDPAYPLDLTPYKHSAVDPKGLPELVQESQKIREELQRWTDGRSGLQVNTADRRSMTARSDRPYVRAEAQRVRQKEGWVAFARWHWTRALRVYGWVE